MTLSTALRYAISVFSIVAIAGCGGGGASSTPPAGGSYQLSGQFQKGPFVIGSQISVNELDENLNPTGIVYNIQTTDDLGNFSVASKVHSHLVEIIGDGFYMDELTGQLSTTRIQLRAIADLNVNSTVTVNILTSLQGLRLKKLITQGSTYSAANTQSQNEVLTAFGVDPTKVIGLSNLYTMKINGSADADSVLLALSAVLSKMATNAATANATSQPAELSNYINTIASQIQNTGTITVGGTNTARSLAATQIDLAAVRTNVETYYANRGITIVAPKFEEWVDKNASGMLPRRLTTQALTGIITGLTSSGLVLQNNAGESITIAANATSFSFPATIANAVNYNVTVLAQPSGPPQACIVTNGLGTYRTDISTISVACGAVSGIAYVVDVLSYNIYAFLINSTTGALTPVIGSPFAIGGINTTSIVVDPTGKFAYTANYGSGSISGYTINANTGTLTAISGSPFAATGASSIAFNPAGNVAYISSRGGEQCVSLLNQSNDWRSVNLGWQSVFGSWRRREY